MVRAKVSGAGNARMITWPPGRVTSKEEAADRSLAFVEISKDHPNEDQKDCSLRACYTQVVRQHHLRLAETQRQAEERKCFIVESFRCTRRRCGHRCGKLEEGQLESGHPLRLIRSAHLAFCG